MIFFFLEEKSWLINWFRLPQHLLLMLYNTSSMSAKALKTILKQQFLCVTYSVCMSTWIQCRLFLFPCHTMFFTSLFCNLSLDFDLFRCCYGAKYVVGILVKITFFVFPTLCVLNFYGVLRASLNANQLCQEHTFSLHR